MRFFTGVDNPTHARCLPTVMVSANALRRRKSAMQVNDWIMDSGAFTTVTKHGGYPHPVDEYAAVIRRFAGSGNLLVAVAQDYMCEPFALAATGLTIADHQRLTVERYDDLMACDRAGVPIMPVLQGQDADDYLAHLCSYGERLTEGMWVGVGSVCKRNTNPESIVEILEVIHAERPDLKLHGFGVKVTALKNPRVRQLFHSTDSMAWSFAARRQGRDQHDVNEAIAYAARINALDSTQQDP